MLVSTEVVKKLIIEVVKKLIIVQLNTTRESFKEIST